MKRSKFTEEQILYASALGRFATIMTPPQLKERAVATDLHREPWNKGTTVGQKAPLKLKEVWPIRMRLQLAHRARELALFNLGMDSKLVPATWSSCESGTSAPVIA